jgi:hypothetical protein
VRAAGAIPEREFLDPAVGEYPAELADPDLGEPHGLAAGVDADRRRCPLKPRPNGRRAPVAG